MADTVSFPQRVWRCGRVSVSSIIHPQFHACPFPLIHLQYFVLRACASVASSAFLVVLAVEVVVVILAVVVVVVAVVVVVVLVVVVVVTINRTKTVPY